MLDMVIRGIVFLTDNRLICGIFVRKNHISIEFSMGNEIQDADGFLEGSGKYRRHIKLFELKDMKNKKVKYYFKQSFNT